MKLTHYTIMKKFIILHLSIFIPLSFADVCTFKGKVHPESKYEEVSNLYTFSCEWFISHFESYPDPDIILNNVHYIDNWNSMDFIKDEKENLYGVFHNMKDEDVNTIYLELSKKEAYKESEIVNKSILFHEFIHFFIKAASFNKIDAEEINLTMYESITYYAQDQFIQIITKGEKTLLDFLENINKEPKLIKPQSFLQMAFILQLMNYKGFLFNSIEFFKTDTIKKYNSLINGDYEKYNQQHISGPY